MRFLMLVCAGSDFDPPHTIGPDTEAWVARAETDARRLTGGRLRPSAETVVVGPADPQAPGDGVAVVPGARTTDDEQVVGFDLIDCADRDSALELIRAHPMARAGRIELRAVWDDVTD